MSGTPVDMPTYPKARGRCPFHPPQEYGQWREAEGLTRVRLWDGRQAWVATRIDYLRRILADDRFSVDWSHPGMPTISEGTSAPTPTRTSFLRKDDPEHARLRRMVARDFTGRRVAALRPRIEQACAGLLDDMARREPPVDLVPAYTHAAPALIACEILGVPFDETGYFRDRISTMMTPNASREQTLAAGRDLQAYLGELMRRKRGVPGEDTYSRLVNTHLANGDITEDECVVMAILLLVAGYENTASMIAMSFLVLSEHPEQLALVRDTDDPAVVATAVENLLRYMSVIENNLNRVALADVEFDGHLIRAGEGVILNVPAANRDPRAFAAPDVLDVTSVEPDRHIAFGAGVHQCVGQTLARAELQVALPMLLRRFPGIRPAVAIDDLALKQNPLIVGVDALPVTW